jgi:hypothetical protein
MSGWEIYTMSKFVEVSEAVEVQIIDIFFFIFEVFS